ncbi:hypothetical protein JCM19241_1343 [Vibrio ishigakensis]|uniref:Uncharacterized protein n=1 Tax=Vibrio ishigakensis TaxID=1481914 RepID=A0A0B8Q5U7_9VIBR|nr:hypothetical protein JCM19241_1343 [Vibrio ishigakensis]
MQQFEGSVSSAQSALGYYWPDKATKDRLKSLEYQAQE